MTKWSSQVAAELVRSELETLLKRVAAADAAAAAGATAAPAVTPHLEPAAASGAPDAVQPPSGDTAAPTMAPDGAARIAELEAKLREVEEKHKIKEKLLVQVASAPPAHCFGTPG